MPTCRSLSPDAWEQARQALVFYFSRRHGLANAEDLAQETLAAFWKREDFEFEREEDFLRVCYAFARRILQVAVKRVVEQAAEVLDLSRTAAYELIRSGAWPTPVFRLGRLMRIPTAQVLKLLGIESEVGSSRPENASREAG